MIDQSEEAVKASLRNAQANQLGPHVSAETANVFDWLKANTTSKPNERLIPRFDLVILDPPSFTRTRAAVGDALLHASANARPSAGIVACRIRRGKELPV